MLSNLYFFFYRFSYKSKDEFETDIKQMFKNCKTFNEDESFVGRAGVKLMEFFEKKWIEMFDSNE